MDMIDESSGKVPEWLSTHPSHENRKEILEQQLPAFFKIRDDCMVSGGISKWQHSEINLCLL